MSLESTCQNCGEEYDSRRPACPVCNIRPVKAMTTPSTIPTPETDAALTGATWIKASHSTKEYVPAELARFLERRLHIALSALDKLNDMLELGPVLWRTSKRHEHAQKLIEDTLDEITSVAKQP